MPNHNSSSTPKRAPRMGPDPRTSLGTRNNWTGLNCKYRRGEIGWKTQPDHKWTGPNDEFYPDPRPQTSSNNVDDSNAYDDSIFVSAEEEENDSEGNQDQDTENEDEYGTEEEDDHDADDDNSEHSTDEGEMADEGAPARGARVKKESAKKRAAAPDRSTPEVGSSSTSNLTSTNGAQRYPLINVTKDDFAPPQPVEFKPHHNVTLYDGRVIEFCEIPEQIVNKKGYNFVHAAADPSFPHMIYHRQSETGPFTARINFHDITSAVFVDRTGLHFTCESGWRSARSNVCIKTGKFFYEIKITKGIPKGDLADDYFDEPRPHIRMGYSRREASTDKPVGQDAYAYGFKDRKGEKMYLSRPRLCFPNHEDMREGDVIGLEITLPSEQLHKKVVDGIYNPAVDLQDDFTIPKEIVSDVIRDRIPISFKGAPYFEYLNYESTKELEDFRSPMKGVVGSGTPDTPRPTHPVPCMRTLPFSSIKIYKNGVLMDEAFTDLLAFLPPASKCGAAVAGKENFDDGGLGYYPMVSCIHGGCCELNFGPDFWCPPPGYEAAEDEVDLLGTEQATAARSDTVKPVCERYTEQIAEDCVYDIIDEVDLLFRLDEGKPRSQRSMADEIIRGGGVNMKGAKEVIQDDDN